MTATQKTTWTSVIPTGVTQLAAGHFHSLALKSDGTLWKTGANKCGQLGFEGPDSLVWTPDRFFEKIILESLLHESKSGYDATTDPVDDWRGLSL